MDLSASWGNMISGGVSEVLSKKWMTILGTTILSGVLVTSVAFAAGGEAVEQAANKPSPGVQQLMQEIRSLRQTRMEQFKTEVHGLIDKARSEGKITPEEATKLKERGGKGFHHRGPKGGRHGHKGGPRGELHGLKGADEATVKAKLAEAVKNGRITQEQADQMLQKWREWNAAKPTDKQS